MLVHVWNLLMFNSFNLPKNLRGSYYSFIHSLTQLILSAKHCLGTGVQKKKSALVKLIVVRNRLNK